MVMFWTCSLPCQMVFGSKSMKFHELIKGFGPAFAEAHGGVFFGAFLRPVHDTGGVAGFAAGDCLKGDDGGEEGIRIGFPIRQVAVGEDELFVRHDFEEDANVGELFAFGAAHGCLAGASGAEVDLTGGRGPRLRREPLHEQLWLRPTGVEFFTRHVGLANEDEDEFAFRQWGFDGSRQWHELKGWGG